MSHNNEGQREPATTLDLELLLLAIESLNAVQDRLRDWSTLHQAEDMLKPYYLSAAFTGLKEAERNIGKLIAYQESDA